MSWRERIQPVRMQRVALVSTADRVRDLLERAAEAGSVELDLPEPVGERADAAADHSDAEPATRTDPREAALARAGAGFAVRGPVAAVPGWVPQPALPALAAALAPGGAAVVPLPRPPGAGPPTLLHPGGGRRFDPLVQTYATVPYADVDPSLLAGLAYVVMFGMMFGDVGHGAVLILGALVLARGRSHRLARLRRAWPFLLGAGLASAVFGALYGEMFGPTGLVPVVWLAPLEHPVPLLLAAIGLGAVLLSVAYALGVVNRVREGGWGYALYARSGIAGGSLFLALSLIAVGLYLRVSWMSITGQLLAVVGLVLAFVGLLAESGGGAAGGLQAGIELVDVVIRLAANLVSFARLAAFGLTHAALGAVVWQGTTAVWGPGPRAVAAALLFVVGNLIAFTLEALVAGVQALRLEYYELFSRVFEGEGRPFRPWQLPAPIREVM